jgi:hypothetical protein
MRLSALKTFRKFSKIDDVMKYAKSYGNMSTNEILDFRDYTRKFKNFTDDELIEYIVELIWNKYRLGDDKERALTELIKRYCEMLKNNKQIN